MTINLKILCFLLIFSCIFINCTAAREKPLPAKISESRDEVNPETHKFESKSGNFSIDISQPPFQTLNSGSEAEKRADIDVGKQFVWKSEKTVYTILYSNPYNPDGNEMSQSSEEIESMKVGTRKGLAKNKATLVSEKPLSASRYPGTEFRYVSAEGVKFICRIYLINSIGYQVVGGYADDNDENDVLKILDSFKLITENN